MGKHEDGYLSFDVPRDWDDRTIVAYSAPKREDGTRAASVVVTHRKHQGSIDELVADCMRLTSRRLPGFLFRGRQDRVVGDRPAVALSFASATDERRLAIIPLRPDLAALVLMTARAKDAPSMAPLFDRILASVQLPEG